LALSAGSQRWLSA
jgi:hypothetical protein